MQVWVFLLWGIASLMACWSFSLMVRWGWDWNARKRERLVPMYSKRAFMLAPLLILVCIMLAAYSGYWANRFAIQFDITIGFFRSPLGVIGLLLTSSGLLWITYCLVGDRARGRVRCPKCWYDMNEVPGLRCPECGHESKSRSLHSKTHRSRIAIVLATFMIGLGIYGLAANRRVLIFSDPLAAVPSWVLMAGWEWLPTRWIYDDGTVKPNGSPVAAVACLQNRLGNNYWISKKRTTRFVDQLTKPMIDDKASRWDSRRLGLLSTLYAESNIWQTGQRFPVPTAINTDELFRLCATDLVEIIIASTANLLDEQILDAVLDEPKSAYALAEHWVLWSTVEGESGTIRSDIFANPNVDGHLQIVLAPVVDEIDRPEIVDLINTTDYSRRIMAIKLLMDSGVMNKYYKRLIPKLGAQNSVKNHWESMYYISETVRLLPADMQAEAHAMIAEWLESDHAIERVLALRILNHLVEVNSMDPEAELALDLSGLITIARVHTLDDQRAPFPQYPDSTVAVSTLRLLVKTDRTGLESFPLIRDQIILKNAPYPSSIPAIHWNSVWSDETISAWLDSFGALVESTNPEIRRWVLDNIPTRSDSIYEDQLIEVVTVLLDDPIEENAMKASKTLWDREIDQP